MPKIRRQTTVQIMSMIIDIGRFKDPEKLYAYFGLVPKVRDSGGKEHRRKIAKTGDKKIREIMEGITQSHIRFCDSSATQYYHRKKKEIGTKKTLITASRKILTAISPC